MSQEHFFLIGIGGIGMSALASLLHEKGAIVTGSDLSSNTNTKKLESMGVKVLVGHLSDRIQKHMTVVYTSGIQKTSNPEYLQAKEIGARLWHRSELLDFLMQKQKPLLVTGTHGKTTTTALLSSVLIEAAVDPSFVVGGTFFNAEEKLHAKLGKGKYFVAESDESDGSFLRSKAFGAIVTNAEEDHMEYWKTTHNLLQAFSSFFSQIASKEHLFWCRDDEQLTIINPTGVSYGFSLCSDLVIDESWEQRGASISFSIVFDNTRYSHISCNLAGRHNVLNAAAIFGICLRLGISQEVIRSAFNKFKGVDRRFELISQVQSVLFYDDYAHHPTEVKTTLHALRKMCGEKRIVAIFQPHKYSRLIYQLENFSISFTEADLLIVTDVFSAGEVGKNFSIETVISAIEKNSNVQVVYLSKEVLTQEMLKFIQPHDVVIALGAGDITKKITLIANNYAKRPKKLSLGMIFGGRSKEHEISLASAKYIIDHIDPDLYQIKLFGVDKLGGWLHGKDCLSLLEQKHISSESIITPEILQNLLSCELSFPIFHGPMGEDGMIHAFLQTLGVTPIGSSVESSYLCMNKAWVKDIAIANGMKTAKFVNLFARDWKEGQEKFLQKIGSLRFPVYVKAAHLGSSIGITRVENIDAIIPAINNSFLCDTQVIVEEEIVPRQLEFAILGTDVLHITDPGEILSGGEFYDYEKKYGQNSMKTLVQAPLSEEKIKEGKELALKIYRLLGCSTMARVDFFLDQQEQYYINELNPIPGFADISLYPKMLQETQNISVENIVNTLIISSMYKARKTKKVGLQ